MSRCSSSDGYDALRVYNLREIKCVEFLILESNRSVIYVGTLDDARIMHPDLFNSKIYGHFQERFISLEIDEIISGHGIVMKDPKLNYLLPINS
jgi:hypothetical protein